MTKVETCVDDKKGLCRTEIKGSLTELLADTCCIIESIYRAIKQKDAMLANVYKDFIKERLFEIVFECMPAAEINKDKEVSDAREKIDKTLDELAKLVADMIGIK